MAGGWRSAGLKNQEHAQTRNARIRAALEAGDVDALLREGYPVRSRIEEVDGRQYRVLFTGDGQPMDLPRRSSPYTGTKYPIYTGD